MIVVSEQEPMNSAEDTRRLGAFSTFESEVFPSLAK